MSSEEEVRTQLDITDQPNDDSDGQNKSKVDELIQKDITDVQHFKSTIESLSRIVFLYKDGATYAEGVMPMPNDTMFAYAFEAGLLQMCLKNLARFSNTGYDEILMKPLDFILRGAIAVMFNDESSKAIANVYGGVVLAVKDPDVRALENSKYDKAVKMVLHILGTNVESLNKTIDDEGNIICITCKINLEVKGRAIKRCGGCKKATYCSIECQKADWKRHKEHCKKRIVDPSKHNVVNFGSKTASHEKMAIHSENALQAAQSIFNRGIIGWLHQANQDGLNILDCLVCIDFRKHLPHTRLLTPDELIAGTDHDYWGGEPCPPQMKTFLKDHHAKMVADGCLLALCITVPPRDKPLAARGSVAITPAPFRGHFYPGGWPAYQASFKKN